MLFNIFHRSKPLPKLPIITDIHNHVVPGVDDGSPDVETSLMLMEHLHDWGFQRLFASPHSTQDTFENTPQSIEKPVADLTDALGKSGLDLEFHHHFEYRLDNFFISQFEAGNILCLPGNYLLVENSFSVEPYGLESLLFNIREKGYTPILAHPERYRYYSDMYRHRYEELHEYGLFFQVNLPSLAGHYGHTARQMALYLLEKGWAQFVGTDLHRMSHVESIEHYLRSSDFKKDLKYFERLQNDSI